MSVKRKARKKFIAEEARLQARLCDIQGKLDCAWSAFDNITDPNIMDANIYEISALRSRYNCAVRDIKALYSQEG